MTTAPDAAAVPTADGSLDELRRATRDLQAELLVARDAEIGLRAEVARLTERLTAFAGTPLEEAERLRDEAAELRVLAAAQVDDIVRQHRQAVEDVYASTTWRVGRLALAPVRLARRVVRPR